MAIFDVCRPDLAIFNSSSSVPRRCTGDSPTMSVIAATLSASVPLFRTCFM